MFANPITVFFYLLELTSAQNGTVSDAISDCSFTFGSLNWVENSDLTITWHGTKDTKKMTKKGRTLDTVNWKATSDAFTSPGK